MEQLSGGDVLKFKEVVQISYNEAFTHLRYERAKAEYHKKYQEIITKR